MLYRAMFSLFVFLAPRRYHMLTLVFYKLTYSLYPTMIVILPELALCISTCQ